MSGFQFSANRLINKDNASLKSLIDENSNDEIKNNKASVFQGHFQDLISTDAYRVLKDDMHFPALDPSEKILGGNIFPHCGTVIVTNKRILAYDTEESILRQPFFQEFSYESNEFGILPIVKLLKDDEDPRMLDLFIIDSVTGQITFVLKLQFSPDVPLLREEKKLKLTLAHGEFATLCEYSPICGMVVATNYRRVFNIDLKDAFGHAALSYSELVPSKVFLGYMRNPKYLVQSYDSQNKVISLSFHTIDDTSCLLAVLEEQGFLTIIKLVKGSGHVNIMDLDLFKGLIPTVQSSTKELSFTEQRELHKSIKFKSVEFMGENSDKYLVLISNNNESVLLMYHLGDNGCISSLHSYRLKDLESVDKYPQLYTVDQAGRIVIVSGFQIVITDINDDLTDVWEDFFAVQQSVDILGINRDGNILRLFTNDGPLEVQMLGRGKHRTSSDIIEARIEQDLEYMAKSNLNILQLSMYSQFKSGINADVENAVRNVCNKIVHNEFGITSTVVLVQDNLQLRVSLLDHLAQYAAANFEISVGTKMVLVNAREKLGIISLLYKCLELENEDMVKMLTVKCGCTLGDILKDHGSNSLDMLEDYLTKIIPAAPKSPSELLKIANLVCDELTDNYINPEKDLKSQILDISYSSALKEYDYPIFWGHTQFLESINQLLEGIYTSYALSHRDKIYENDVHDIDSNDVQQVTSNLNVKVSQTAVGLSLILYYCCNDLLQLAQTVENNADVSNLSCDGLHKFYQSNRANWIKVFIAFEKQDQMMGLIEGFNDLRSLSELLDSERQYVEDQLTIQTHEPIEIENLSAKIESRFDRCFNDYGYDFAQNLFNYYVHTGKIDVLLSRFLKYAEFIDRFLFSNITYNKFSWILDIKRNKYRDAAQKLLSCTKEVNDDNLSNKTLELNIAKLSMVASADKVADRPELCQIEAELIVANSQSNIASKLQQFVESSGKTFEETVEKLLKQSSYLQQFPYLSQIVRRLLMKNIENEKPLSLIELVDLFTLVDFSGIDFFGFDEALHLISHLLLLQQRDKSMRSESLYSSKFIFILQNFVLKRLFLTENWGDLDAGKNLEKSRLLRILASLTDYNISIPTAVQKISTTEKELDQIAPHSKSRFDYLKENDLFADLTKTENLERFLPQ